MKCKNSECGAEISDSAKFCEYCGLKVTAVETNTTRACPQCSASLKKGQRFCGECGWKVDPNIFEVPKLFCVGKNEDGTACRAELVPGVKFCPKCGSDQSQASLTNIPQDVGDQQSSLPQGHSSSGSSSRSESPDTWGPPGGMVTNTGISEVEETVDSDSLRSQNDEQKDDDRNPDQVPVTDLHLTGDNGVSMETDQHEPMETETTSGLETETQILAENSNQQSSFGDGRNPVISEDQVEIEIKETNTTPTYVPPDTPHINREIPVQGSTPGQAGQDNTGTQQSLPGDNDGMTGPECNMQNKEGVIKVPETAILIRKPTGQDISTDQGDHQGNQNNNANDRGLNLAKKFEKSVNVKSPVKQDQNAQVENKEDELNGNVSKRDISLSLENMGSCQNTKSPILTTGESGDGKSPVDSTPEGSIDETGDGDGKSGADNGEDEESWKEKPLPDTSSSSDDDGNDKQKDGKNPKQKEKRQSSRKQQELKKKDRKKRRQDRGKNESEETPAKQGKKETEGKPDATPPTGRQEEAMEQLPINTETRSADKDQKNEANAEKSAANKGPAYNTRSAAESSSSDKSYADAAASGSTSDKGKGQKYNAFAEIHFHCIVPKTFIFTNLGKDKLYVVFEETTLGGWHQRKHLMKGDRTLDGGYVEFTGVVAVPKSLLTRGRLTYNYVMDHGVEFYDTWEYVYTGTMSGNTTGRHLGIKIGDLINGIYHRFDGVIRDNPNKNKSAWQSFKELVGIDDYKKILIKDAEFSGRTFQPLWQLTSFSADGINGEDLLNHVAFVVDGLKQTYCKHASLWMYSDFDKVVGSVILQPIVSKILKVLQRFDHPSKEGQILHVITAITIASLLSDYEIVLSDEERALLCESFLPKADENNTIAFDLDTVHSYFPTKKKKVCEAVEKLVRQMASNTHNPCWMFCLPAVHFLQNLCRPFEKASGAVNHDDHRPVWWGIAELGNSIDYFKVKTESWEIPPSLLLQKLVPYFPLDYYLPRAVLAALKYTEVPEFVQSGCFSPDAVLAVMFYYIKSSTGYNKAVYEDCMKKIFDQVIVQQISKDNGKKESFFDAWRSCKIAADVLKEITRYPNTNKGMVVLAAEAFFVSADLYDKMQAKIDWSAKDVKKTNLTKDCHRTLVEDMRYKTARCLSDITFYKEELEYLQRWNSILKIRIPNGDIRDSFLKYMEEALQIEIEKKGADEDLLKIYLFQNEDFESAIQGLLSELALKAIQKFSNFDITVTGDDRNNKVVMRLGDLIDNVLERGWTKRQQGDDHQILEHAITWASFPTFIEMFYKFSGHLKADTQRLLDKAITVLKEVIDKIIQGGVPVKDLEMILAKRENFQKIVSGIKDVSLKTTMLTLNVREKELRTYKDTCITVKEFLNYCIHCKANTVDMEEKLHTLENLEPLPLKDLVKTVQFDEITDVEGYQPFVTVFGLSKDHLDILPHIIECSHGLLFTKLWEEKGIELKREKGRKLWIMEVLEEVWEPTFSTWRTISQNLKRGDILFSEFERFFRSTDLGNLRAELLMLDKDGDSNWVNERLDQIEKYRNLKSCEFGAEAILEVVQSFHLEGDFSQINNICQFTRGADTSMNKLDKSLLKTCSILREVTKERAECLKVFIRCKPLVDWLRESMKSGLKELKVFVELASISAGEGDMEIDKVNCLHSATTGYAPLIFNLEKNCNTKMFLDKCQQVWKELMANPELPKKLIDTNRQLAWLQTVKKSHGSVEVSSLQQAEAINSKGIYKVGNISKADNLRKTVLTEVLEVHVTEEDESGAQRKHYRYDQLRDLQSRLMLVAGKAEKGKDEVDRFMLILDSVVRLGKIYSKLIEEGCVLFSQWHVRFLCDKGRKACASLHFGNGANKRVLKGRISGENEDVSAIIPKLATFLEQCHEKWLKYIEERREKYYCLNYFTIDQMVILQQELVKVGTTEEPSILIYPLLSAVKKDCSVEDLKKAMSSAQADVETIEAQAKEEVFDQEPEVVMEEPEEQRTSRFIQEMMMAGYTVDLAREALRNVSPDNIDEGIVWCMDHEDSYVPMEEDRPTSPDRDQTMFTQWTQSDQSVASIYGTLVDHLGVTSGENDIEILIKSLEDLWEEFLKSISSSVKDYLSIEHLGMILNRLSEQETFEVDRTFLPCFVSGEPNLIICRQREIYNSVISVYSHEEDRPLPQSDEVLLCTPHTTLDMLEVFWRRALFADDDKIYCLVNADLLDYDVSDKGERSLERHMKHAESRGKKYNLVVICSSENEDRSRVVAALDKYRRPQLPTDVTSVKKYLLTKLKVDKSVSGIRPASAVDFERCSVRIVKSWRAGIGKTLYKKRMVAEMSKLVHNINRRKASNVTIPLHERVIDTDGIMDILLDETLSPRCPEPRIFHIDISHVVQEGVDAFLFQLLILGCLGHSSGKVWRRSELDYYIIESMPLLARDTDTQGTRLRCLHHCLEILPHITCRSPQETLEIISGGRRPLDYTDHDRLFDSVEFKSPTFQRPYQYLMRLDTNRRLEDVNANVPEGDKKQCLNILLRHCGIRDPSWSELYHFVSFLNKQLQDFEVSAFCSLAAVEDLPGFAKFVLRFLIQMSRDFSTRSLVMSEESPLQLLKRQLSEDEGEGDNGDNIIQLYQMRRTWETSPHPYLFFNPDHNSMTFLGFNIDRRSGNLVDVQTNAVLEQGIMQQNLFDALQRNSVNLAENFDTLPRLEKVTKLCNVMGLEVIHDPDPTYELTTDNVKKILAIYMRFRCDIPVVIMGETGCGKTRLIKFMCALQQPPGVDVENMILMKVHGGTKAADIIKKVRKAEKIASKNAEEFRCSDYRNMDTVLFFDEANTTEAIGVIKEIMCDKSLGGKPIKLHEKLKIVAACNPYRKHSEDLIKRLEQAGLGYHVNAKDTADKLGHVPMRHLVYRVQSLPQSMLPLVWDFGQLNTNVEEMYIRQMVLRYINNGQLPDTQGLDTVVSKILTVSQDFMRAQQDECSFVSLRDVERVLKVMSWFYEQSEDDNLLFERMRGESEDSDSEAEDEELMETEHQEVDDVTRSLVLALGVCYHACLKNREQYRETVAAFFTPPLQLPGGADTIAREIDRCQEVFLDSVELAPNIAKNQALKENVFMMIVCIELRIPMFLVGKPGSSKSLAKTIVADAMQGNAAHNDLFKNYKQVQMVSYQCSPISVPEGIVGTFRQCAAYQKDKDLDRFVSIVVLDEIGLAEDSPRMPLKTLHPLLEDGCPDDEEPEKYKKVAFIGISNWALDPAKMNRGILVQREVPKVEELMESAEGICSTSKKVQKLIKAMIPLMAQSYLDLFQEASDKMREFFGLRDFYSLLKMLYRFVHTSKKKPSWAQLEHCILRNFGGLEDVKPVQVFHKKLAHLVDITEKRPDDPDCTPSGMIQACLTGDRNLTTQSNSESRYLLLLTENYGALTVLQQKIFTMDNVQVIFGSSFPKDQEYTQVCRNINRIKVCMETGSTVILLNLENLYESLYDALNQYYVMFGGERYVDLGLGTHRVKCRVHKNFRLIVVAEKQVVYDKFPIPLINRLEKHFLSLKTMLSPVQLKMTEKLQEWAKKFCEVKGPPHLRRQKNVVIGDSFMGYHADTCAAIILHVCQDMRCDDEALQEMETEVLNKAKFIMLWCATPDAVIRQHGEKGEIFDIYFKQQHHESLAEYLQYKIVEQQQQNLHVQITTNSKTLASADIEILCRFIPIKKESVTLLTLQSFDTEQQFSRKIKAFFDQPSTSDKLLIVQCDCGNQNSDLVACARYAVQGELQQNTVQRTSSIHVVFVIQLPGIAGGCFTGFQCGLWHSVHIDDIHPSAEDIPTVADMHGQTVSALLTSTNESSDITMEIEEPSEEQPMEGVDTNEREVDLMDIDVELRQGKKYQHKKHFKIDSLIKKCIQPALGNVKDQSSDSSRATVRLKIILNCLQHEEGEQTVMSGIAKHLSFILHEKERNFGRIRTDWLSSEASKPENTNRAGTFRKFAVQCIESRIIPILAGVIAFIDTNNNLDILVSSPPHSWQLGLWVQIFNNPDLTKLDYKMIVSPTKQQELQEISVKMTSKDGKLFSSAMPFSWLIFGQIEEVMRETLQAKNIEDSHFDVVMKASEILCTLPMGGLLSSIEGTHLLDVLKCYIKDFVHMVHPVQTEEECSFVCESIINGCRHLIKGEFGRLIPSLLGCHMVYTISDSRYKNFSNIVHVWPGCCLRMAEFQKESSAFYLLNDDEMTLDILALHLLVQDLEPNKDALNRPESRTRWLQKVCNYRPIIERIFGHFTQDKENKEYTYGERCGRGIESSRYQWTRTCVVKLFIEHVCAMNNDIDIRRCMPLWVTLREGANMKEIESLEKVEKFMRSCNRDVVAQCFGQQSKCVSCENGIEGAPVTLPCEHVICRKCFYDCLAMKEYECPNCQKTFPKTFDPNKRTHKTGEVKKYRDYRNRCNSFFMEVVSQLCFAEGTPPSQAVIHKLLSFITGRVERKRSERIRVVSKELTIFDDAIDPTPVVRSFLLQLLMQTSGSDIEKYLNEYFINASELVRETSDPSNLIELCQLVLQCMEDSLHQQYVNRDDEVTTVTKMLRETAQTIVENHETLDKIDYISRVRFSLAVVARYMHNLFGTAQKSRIDATLRRMFDAAAQLCEGCHSPWPRKYFVKQLCRCYGTDSYQTVLTKSGASFLRWVKLPELKEDKVKECHDRYIVMGEEYKELRETIVTTVLNENAEKLQQLLQQPKEEWQTRIRLLLALHREIAMNSLYDGTVKKIAEQGKQFLIELIMTHQLIRNKETTQRVLQNALWGLPGNITPGMGLAEQNMACLMTHFLILMVEIPGKSTLLTPLHRIAFQPGEMMNCYYPTMPQDELLQVKEALLAARRQDGNENPVFYRCPNGHPYVIGNCGRAVDVGLCKECGREIGGQGYQLRPGNVLDAGVDRTEKGHLLGRAGRLGPIVAPERKLDRASFAILRLLTHMSMYIGANVDIEAICQTVRPNILPPDVALYLIEHMDLDLTSIQNILGRNRDDVYLLIHHLLTQIMDSHTLAVIGENFPENVCGLLDKNSRSDWEDRFSKKYITPVVQNLDKVLKNSSDMILKDQRLGNDPLLQILYETDGPREGHDVQQIQNVPAVWRYRAMINVNHLRQNLDATKRKLPVLRLFLREEHHLRAIRFIPSIMRLQKILIQKYSRKLDRAEASTLSISDVKLQMRQERRAKEFSQLLEDYIEAWNCVKESLETYVCPANESIVTVDKEHCRMDITDKTPVSYLIPTHRDAGLSSYVLLFFLLKKQNMFLQNYCAENKISENSLPRVHVKDISSAHLISYHPDRDLLPLVLANCNYSFEVGQGTRVDYNFTNLERQLMDRFLFSKSIVTSIQEIETITYRSESTNAVVFRNLYNRIKQERINTAVLSQICGELRLKSYPDLCESLDKLDVAISFLKSVGADPESSLHGFMTETLRIEKPFPSPKAQQASKCKHTMSLWITLAMERAKFLAKYDKKAFEGISDNFKKPLTEGQTNVLEDVLNSLPIEQLDALVDLLFECIILKIDVPQNMDDEDYVDISKVSLRDALFGYIDACPYEEDLVIDDTLMTAIGQFPSDKEDPRQVLTGQSVDVWCLVNRIFTQKQRQRH